MDQPGKKPRIDGSREIIVDGKVVCKYCAGHSHKKGHSKNCPKSQATKEAKKKKDEAQQRKLTSHFVVKGKKSPAPATKEQSPVVGITASQGQTQSTAHANPNGGNSTQSKLKSTVQAKQDPDPRSASRMLGGMKQYLPRVKEKTKDLSFSFTRPPPPVASIIEYLWNEYFPKRFKKDEPRLYGSQELPLLERLRKDYPCCQSIVPITVPQSVQPDIDYVVAEGTTIYFVRWEWGGIRLCCPVDGCSGFLCQDKVPFVKAGCTATPIYHMCDLRCPVDWAVSMGYQCNKCRAKYKGDDGQLLMQVPPHIRQHYPVEPRYVIPKQIFRLSRSVSAQISELMVTSSSGEEISNRIYAVRVRYYEHVVYNFFHRCLEAKVSLKGKVFVGFVGFFGNSHPSGKFLVSYRVCLLTSFYHGS